MRAPACQLAAMCECDQGSTPAGALQPVFVRQKWKRWSTRTAGALGNASSRRSSGSSSCGLDRIVAPSTTTKSAVLGTCDSRQWAAAVSGLPGMPQLTACSLAAGSAAPSVATASCSQPLKRQPRPHLRKALAQDAGCAACTSPSMPP